MSISTEGARVRRRRAERERYNTTGADLAPPHLTTAVRHDGIEDRVAVEEPLEIRVGGEPWR
jgi:hypothetical protein